MDHSSANIDRNSCSNLDHSSHYVESFWHWSPLRRDHVACWYPWIVGMTLTNVATSPHSSLADRFVADEKKAELHPYWSRPFVVVHLATSSKQVERRVDDYRIDPRVPKNAEMFRWTSRSNDWISRLLKLYLRELQKFLGWHFDRLLTWKDRTSLSLWMNQFDLDEGETSENGMIVDIFST